MNSWIHKTYVKWLSCFLIAILILSPLLNISPSHAAGNDSALLPSAGISSAPEAAPASATESTYGDPQDPLAPGNLRLESVSHNQAKFAWDFVEGSNDIQVWNADTNGWITWGNLWTRSVTGLSPETTYRIYITWNHDAGKEHKSNVLEFTTTKDTSEYKEAPLTPPSHLKVTEVTGDSVTLNWGSSPGATGYDLYVNGSWKGGTWENSVTSITYAPLETGKTYTFEVGAQNPPNPASAKSNSVTLTWGELSPPEGLQVITATRTAASLGWAPVPGATDYDIYQDGTKIGNTDESRFAVKGLKEGRTYTYRIVAKNSLWTSAESEPVSVVPGGNYNNITYYTSWSAGSDRNFKPTDVDVSQITHINYAFADICWKKYGTTGRDCENPDIPLQKDYVYDGEIVIGDPELDFDNMSSLVSIRERNPHLKLMVSVGGWSWSKNFSNMAKTEETRRTFANSAVDFLREYRLDGLDIDWEYPVEGGDTNNSRGPEDRENFTLLMKTVREALDAAGSEDGKYYLLTIASAQGDNFVVNADLTRSVRYLDFVNIMTYDYSGNWEVLAHHNAPLFYDRKHPKSSAKRNHVLGGLNGHLTGGVPAYKLVAGIPFYGKGWGGCPPTGEYRTCAEAIPGTWGEVNNFDYTDLENNYVNKNGYVRYWNEAAKTPYLYNDEKKVFITYNDKTTMMYTASLVKSLDIAGVMSWEISGDRNRTLTTQLAQDLPIHGEANASALPAPKHPALASRTANSLQIQWEPVKDATEYEIYVDKAMVGATAGTSYTVTSLDPGQTYKIHLLAVTKTGNDIQKVSMASEELSAMTTSAPTDPGGSTGGGSGGTGGTPQPQPQPQPTKGKDQLDANIVKQADTTVVSLAEDAAVKQIKGTDSSNFKIEAGDGVKHLEANIPQGVITAIANKGAQASLSVIVNGTEHRIPAALISGEGAIKISIGVPADKDVEIMTALLKGKKVLSNPTLFKIERIHGDKTVQELKHFGKFYVSEFIALDPKSFLTKRTAGMIHVPGSGELRSVPTLFKSGPNGKAIAELKKTAGGLYALAENRIIFNDVKAAWAIEEVAQAAARLISSGEQPNSFGGSQQITRAEIVSMIVRGLGIIPDGSGSSFKDVGTGTKYAKEIAAAKAAGLIQGRTGDRFDPEALLTRQELAVLLVNAMKYAGATNDADFASLAKFKDRAEIALYAKASLALMAEKKIILGVSPDKIAPEMNVTRAQTAVTVIRMLRAIGLTD